MHGEGEHQYTVVTGAVDVPKTNKVIAVAIVTLRVPSSVQVLVRVCACVCLWDKVIMILYTQFYL